MFRKIGLQELWAPSEKLALSVLRAELSRLQRSAKFEKKCRNSLCEVSRSASAPRFTGERFQLSDRF